MGCTKLTYSESLRILKVVSNNLKISVKSYAGDYRYGFNGKENDNEILGEGKLQDYGYRMYRPDLAKFFAQDPLKSKFPMLTPYQFASNTPVMASDLDGLEADVQIIIEDSEKPVINIIAAIQVVNYTTDQTMETLTQVIDKGFEITNQEFSGTVDINGSEVSLNVSMQSITNDGKAIVSGQEFESLGFNQNPPKIMFVTYTDEEIKILEDPNGEYTLGEYMGNSQAGELRIGVLPDSYEGVLRSDFSVEKLSATLAHELGHFFGLAKKQKSKDPTEAHSKDPSNLMYENDRYNGTDINEKQKLRVINTVTKEGGKKSEKKKLKSLKKKSKS